MYFNLGKGNDIDMRIKLEMASPIITTYPSIANVLSLLGNDKGDMMPWLCDHFIQIIVRPNHDDTYGDFYDHADLDNFFRIMYGMPGLGWMRANSDSAGFTDFIDYIRAEIQNGYGLEACLDRYYFKFSEVYQKKHLIHSSFIIGFDDEKEEVYVFDFWDKGQYEEKTISFDEVRASMNNNWLINLFRREDLNYEMKPDLMKRYFEDYLIGIDSFGRYAASNKSYNDGVIFGVNYYDYLIGSIEKGVLTDRRMFHILYDHKILMKHRLEYLIKLNKYDNDRLDKVLNLNEKIIDKSAALRGLALKFNIKQSSATLQQLKDGLSVVKEQDMSMVKDIISII